MFEFLLGDYRGIIIDSDSTSGVSYVFTSV